jgi:Ferric reductase like transmembrane component
VTITLAAATASSNAKALWYLTRGFGLVALILFSLVMVLGLTQAVRYTRPGWPRFVISALHKNAALLAVAVLAVHIATAVADSYAPIRVVDVFVPFVSRYRPFWLGLGALAFDLMIALVTTSLLRSRLGHRSWRAVHWAAYACWPVAVVHGLGTGSDAKLGWVLIINLACVGAVLAALWWRLAQGWSIANATRRGAAVMASLVLPVAVAAWAITGPLRPGWARKAGTPAALISSAATVTQPAGGTAPRSGRASTSGLAVPFSARFQGSQRQSGPDSSGLVSVTITGAFAGGQLTVVLTGQPAPGGGVELTGSEVSVGSPADPHQYQGHVTQLEGPALVASLSDANGGSYTATINLRLTAGAALSGTIEVTR